jgi:hypothetical protein
MQVKYWKIDDEDIPEDVKSRAIEHITEMLSQEGDTFYSDYDGYFPDKIDRILGHPKPMYWDLDRGNYIQFELDLSCNRTLGTVDEWQAGLETFRKWLKIPKRTWDKIDLGFSFENIRENSTILEFNTIYMEDLTKKDEEYMERASEIFSDAIHDTLVSLRDSYEYYMYDEENHIEMAIANDWCFDESGDFVYPD